MAKLFNKKAEQLSPRETLEAKYNSSTANLLLVVIFTTVNVVLLALNANSYFLFSAFIPYFIADLGMYLSGSYPAEYYYDVPDMEFVGTSFLVVCLVIAAVCVLLYLLSWFFAKKKKVGWLIFAAVLFCIDTAAMFLITGISADMIIDILFHAWVIFSLFSGIVNYNKLKKLPVEEAAEVIETAPENEAPSDAQPEAAPNEEAAETDPE